MKSRRRPRDTASDNDMYGINTTKRYIYVNLYAWVLLIGAVIIGLIPLYKFSLWLIIPQAGAALAMIIFAIKILRQFPHKKREYALLMERNSDALRPDSFWCYADAPCGRLLMSLVLKDLGYDRDTYRSIVKKYR